MPTCPGIQHPRGPRQLRQPKHPKVRAWLERHPRWTFHFTPTSASWLNAVESFFARLTQRRLKRGVFPSLVDLQAAIIRDLVEHNAKPSPLVWTADPDAIIVAAKRGYQTLDLSTRPFRRTATPPTRSVSTQSRALGRPGARRRGRSG